MEEDRPKIFKYIINRFGESKVARVASFGTSQAKGVIDDVGRHLAQKWRIEHESEGKTDSKVGEDDKNNPWSLPNVAKIKAEFDADPEGTKEKYPELFYYFDGLLDTKISQSVHPAGMVISPITLDDNFGVFEKDGENCLMLDMDNIHDYTGLAKYDFLLLDTIKVIRDTYRYLGKPYPRTHEIDWDDQNVWTDMLKSSAGIFQFSAGTFAHESLKKFKPKNIFEMSLVAACIRPSGASYREDLLARKVHKNPSPMIDELLKDNLGYLVYQEDTILFLQEVCGLSGSQADTIRRGIGRKRKDILDAAMPSILEGYCSKSDKPREEAEKEAKEFLQIIEDSSSYQFGKNHSIAYCLLGYICAYCRYYYPLEFITASLNNASNEEDIRNLTAYASQVGIKITMPKWGLSKGEYFYDTDKHVIAKGLSSVKYMSESVAEELYNLARSRPFPYFMDVLSALDETSINSRQLDILIKIDFFSDFGNQRELLQMTATYNDIFNKGKAKQVSKAKIAGTPLERIVEKYAVGVTKSGVNSKFYTLLDIRSILIEAEEMILAEHMEDLSDVSKVQNFAEVMGYAGYVSGREEDRRKLYIMDSRPLVRKKDGKKFGQMIATKSIGSGVESRFTIFTRNYVEPLEKGDIIYCRSFERDGQYFRLLNYEKLKA